MSSNQSKEHYNESEKFIPNEIIQSIKDLKEEIKILKIELRQAKNETC